MENCYCRCYDKQVSYPILFYDIMTVRKNYKRREVQEAILLAAKRSNVVRTFYENKCKEEIRYSCF